MEPFYQTRQRHCRASLTEQNMTSLWSVFIRPNEVIVEPLYQTQWCQRITMYTYASISIDYHNTWNTHKLKIPLKPAQHSSSIIFCHSNRDYTCSQHPRFLVDAIQCWFNIEAIDDSMYVGFSCTPVASVISVVFSGYRCVPLFLHSGLYSFKQPPVPLNQQ